jgi:hypothetical protein
MKIGEDINRIPAGEFLLSTGLLFEINRRILHPFGLALEVVEQEDEMRQLHVVISEGLLDFRSDPEGIVFGERSFINGKSTLNKFLDEYGMKKLLMRQEKLGYIVQHPEFDYLASNAVYIVNQAKLDASTVANAGTSISANHVTTAANAGVTEVRPAAQNKVEAAAPLPGTEHMSVAERNAALRAKNKIDVRKGKLSDIHNTPGGEPCTNPVITREPLPGGGTLTVCDSCGATLQDSDMVN